MKTLQLVSNANMDLEHVREEIESKHMELEQATVAVNSLKVGFCSTCVL